MPCKRTKDGMARTVKHSIFQDWNAIMMVIGFFSIDELKLSHSEYNARIVCDDDYLVCIIFKSIEDARNFMKKINFKTA